MQNNNENINDTTPSLPFDDVWADLKPALDKEAARREKRKKRFIIFWFTFIAISVSGGLLMVNGKKGNSEKLIVKSEALNKSKFKSQNQRVEAPPNVVSHC